MKLILLTLACTHLTCFLVFLWLVHRAPERPDFQ